MPDSNVTPFSVAIFRDPQGGLIEAFHYGADERDLFLSDVKEARQAGFTVWASWQPVWSDGVNAPQKLEGWFRDAYGDYRKVGDSDVID